MRYALYVRKSSEDSSKQIQSIENQLQVLQDKAKKEELRIVKIYSEDKSAKKPGRRDQFKRMIEDIENGLVDGIICWKLDRLSRNPIDGGLVQHLLIEKTIKQIVTHEKTFYPEDNTIMLAFELGMATEYSHALGQNVRRGMNYKAEKGEYPSLPPIGYLNVTNPITEEKSIMIDQDRAPLVRKLWDLLLSNQLSMGQLVEKAHTMGLRKKSSRGKPEKKLTRHGLHCIFSQPFYYGMFRWNKQLYPGTHQRLVTKEEFDLAQKIISGNKSAPRPKRHIYAFKGLIKCGECGASITAEHKDKTRRDGSVNHRIYYRCTHKLKDSSCKQQAVREENLEKQFLELLDSIKITEDFGNWVSIFLQDQNEEYTAKRDSIRKQQQKAIEKIDNDLDRLLDLRLNNEIDKDIFVSKKESLMSDKRAIEKDLSLATNSQEDHIDRVVEIFEFCQEAKDLFEHGTYDDKNLVLRVLGSHYSLKDQKLTIELAKSFKLVYDAVNSKWILNPRFATLETRVNSSHNAFECELIENGADDGT